MEQGKRKVEEINNSTQDSRVARLEEQVRKLQSIKSGTAGTCQTCTRPTHAKGECPGKKLECFACGLVGHFRGAAACKGKKAAGGKKKKKVKANQVVEEESEENDHDATEVEGIGRVVESVRAVGEAAKSKTADLQMTILDLGQPAMQRNVELLVDSGVYRTLLTEE